MGGVLKADPVAENEFKKKYGIKKAPPGMAQRKISATVMCSQKCELIPFLFASLCYREANNTLTRATTTAVPIARTGKP